MAGQGMEIRMKGEWRDCSAGYACQGWNIGLTIGDKGGSNWERDICVKPWEMWLDLAMQMSARHGEINKQTATRPKSSPCQPDTLGDKNMMVLTEAHSVRGQKVQTEL